MANYREITAALKRNPNTVEVAREMGVPRRVVLDVKRQLPASQMRSANRIPAHYTEQQMFDALRRVQAQHGGAMSAAYYKEHRAKADPNLTSFQQRFGSWNAALRKAKLPTNTPRYKVGTQMRYGEADLIDGIQKVAAKLGRAPTYAEYEKASRKDTALASGQTIRNRMGRWLEVLAAAGL